MNTFQLSFTVEDICGPFRIHPKRSYLGGGPDRTVNEPGHNGRISTRLQLA